MKNNLIYYYNIYIDEIKKINTNYYFEYNNKNFVIEEYKNNISDCEAMYKLNEEMLSRGAKVFKIIITKENSIIFSYEEKNYILMELPTITNRLITYEDIIKFRYITSNYEIIKTLDKSQWSSFWEKKIDFYEYNFKDIEGKYNILQESVNYYIGLGENAISYYNDNIIEQASEKQVCHRRIGPNTDLYDFYNPLNIIIDYKERDIGEYLKEYVIDENFSKENIEAMLDKLIIDRNGAIRIIARTLFPTYYFDLYDKITIENQKEEKIISITEKRKNIEFLIKTMFLKYKNLNIPYINWILKN